MSQTPSINNVSVQEAHDRQTHGAILVDVRTSAETELGRPIGSICIPLDELPNRLGELNSTDEIYLSCRSGGRSTKAAEYLTAQGFTNVANVSGGFTEWSAQKLPTE